MEYCDGNQKSWKHNKMLLKPVLQQLKDGK